MKEKGPLPGRKPLSRRQFLQRAFAAVAGIATATTGFKLAESFANQVRKPENSDSPESLSRHSQLIRYLVEQSNARDSDPNYQLEMGPITLAQLQLLPAFIDAGTLGAATFDIVNGSNRIGLGITQKEAIAPSLPAAPEAQPVQYTQDQALQPQYEITVSYPDHDNPFFTQLQDIMNIGAATGEMGVRQTLSKSEALQFFASLDLEQLQQQMPANAEVTTHLYTIKGWQEVGLDLRQVYENTMARLSDKFISAHSENLDELRNPPALIFSDVSLRFDPRPADPMEAVNNPISEILNPVTRIGLAFPSAQEPTDVFIYKQNRDITAEKVEGEASRGPQREEQYYLAANTTHEETLQTARDVGVALQTMALESCLPRQTVPTQRA